MISLRFPRGWADTEGREVTDMSLEQFRTWVRTNRQTIRNTPKAAGPLVSIDYKGRFSGRRVWHVFVSVGSFSVVEEV